jgi:hypothetical protein
VVSDKPSGLLVPRADQPHALACPVRGCEWVVLVRDSPTFLYLDVSEGDIRAHLDSHPVTDYLRTIAELAAERDAARDALRHAQDVWRHRPALELAPTPTDPTDQP